MQGLKISLKQNRQKPLSKGHFLNSGQINGHVSVREFAVALNFFLDFIFVYTGYLQLDIANRI